ncbi:hypothetical protein [Streptomyces atratus]|uniref:hypothetical protein n=1 Tax=Streptomyces atratus TaxID=1893 RepID=UPI0033CED67E
MRLGVTAARPRGDQRDDGDRRAARGLDAWLRLLTLHDQHDLADAEPDTMRFRLYHLPARLARHARRRFLRIERTGPWADAFTTSWRRLTDLPAVT